MPWQAEPALPEPRAWLAAATGDAPAPGSGTWIYAIGGSTYSADADPAVVAYDTQAQSWSPVAAMPTARNGLAAASTPGRIHALGGWNDTSLLAAHEVYQPATNAWSAAAPMPTARYRLAAVTGSDGLVYALGGMQFLAPVFEPVAVVEAYDPATGTWATKAPMPTPRAGLAAVTGHDGRVYALGGITVSGGAVSVLPTVEIYDPATDLWTGGPPLPSARFGLAAAVCPDGLIYAIGGTDANQTSTTKAYSYDPATPAAGWAPRDPLATARAGLVAATGPDGLVYAIGGQYWYPTPADNILLGTVEAGGCYSHKFERKVLDDLRKMGIVGTLLGGVDRGAGGGIVIGKHFIPVPPRSPVMSFILGAAAPYLGGAVESPQLGELVHELQPKGR